MSARVRTLTSKLRPGSPWALMSAACTSAVVGGAGVVIVVVTGVVVAGVVSAVATALLVERAWKNASWRDEWRAGSSREAADVTAAAAAPFLWFIQVVGWMVRRYV